MYSLPPLSPTLPPTILPHSLHLFCGLPGEQQSRRMGSSLCYFLWTMGSCLRILSLCVCMGVKNVRGGRGYRMGVAEAEEKALNVSVQSVCFPRGSQLGRFLRADALLASHLSSQAD